MAFAEPPEALWITVIDVVNESLFRAADLAWLAAILPWRIALAVTALAQALSNPVITIMLRLKADYEITIYECNFIIGVNTLTVKVKLGHAGSALGAAGGALLLPQRGMVTSPSVTRQH